MFVPAVGRALGLGGFFIFRQENMDDSQILNYHSRVTGVSIEVLLAVQQSVHSSRAYAGDICLPNVEIVFDVICT